MNLYCFNKKENVISDKGTLKTNNNDCKKKHLLKRKINI
jgi:hypothetical protein